MFPIQGDLFSIGFEEKPVSFKNYIFGFGVEGTGVYGFQNGTFLKLSFFENFPVCRVLRVFSCLQISGDAGPVALKATHIFRPFQNENFLPVPEKATDDRTNFLF